MSHPTAPSAFSVDVSIVGDDAVATVRGEVDVVSAAALGGAVDALIERGQRHLVLDLAELELIDAAGLRAFAATLGPLRDAGATAVFRSPPPTPKGTRLAAGVPLPQAEHAR